MGTGKGCLDDSLGLVSESSGPLEKREAGLELK